MNTPSTQLHCLVCREPLILRPARGRKSGKPSLMLICPLSGKHFRGFITDQAYVAEVFARVEDHTAADEPRVGTDFGVSSSGGSETDLERDEQA